MKALQLGLQGWQWKQRDHAFLNVLQELELGSSADFRQGWITATSFPSEVHVELLNVGAIPDPYVGFNEHQVQCALPAKIWDVRTPLTISILF